MEFYVNVILVNNLDEKSVAEYLSDNASHITGKLYAFEGELDFIDMECELIEFDVIDENIIVSSLGGLTENELKEIFHGYSEHF